MFLFSSSLALIPLVLLTTARAVSTVTLTQSSAAAATSTSASEDYTSDDAFQKDMLDAHNFYRAEHNASTLTWNESSAAVAVKWADGCRFVHSVSFVFYSLCPVAFAYHWVVKCFFRSLVCVFSIVV